MTRVRLVIARILYQLVRTILRRDHRIIRRKGIYYAVDLSEGIDFSLFMFGNFQNHVTHNKYIILKNNAIVFDIGARKGMFMRLNRLNMRLINSVKISH
jgi:hypothetical protein